MARTIQQIYDAIITEKEQQAQLNALVPNPDTAQTFLTDLTSSSKVAVWRLLCWVIAVAHWAHENIFDQHKAEIEALSETLVTGTLLWYQQQALNFQYGDSLIWNPSTLRFEYPAAATGLKVVTRASAIEGSGQVRIKVAKDDGSGGLTTLDSSEENALRSYINRIKFAGTNLAITNVSADLLKLNITINYDPLLIGADGVLISDGTTRPVDVAINNYVKNLPFDGVFNRTALIDAVQQAVGVIDPVLNSSEAKIGTGSYSDTGQNYTADAGYLEIDPAFPLDDPLNIIYNPVI